MKFGIQLPQAGLMFAGIKDPVQAYETMTGAAQPADESGYETVWLADHVMHPSARERTCFLSAGPLCRLWPATPNCHAIVDEEAARAPINETTTDRRERTRRRLCRHGMRICRLISHGRSRKTS